MTKYEVRVTQTHVDYYHVVADSEEAAQDIVRKRHEFGHSADEVTHGKLVDTIKRKPKIDYALQLSPEGEVIL